MKLISFTVEGYRKYETYRVNDCRSKFCARKSEMDDPLEVKRMPLCNYLFLWIKTDD